MRLGPFERGLGAVPIGLQGVQAILQDVVHFGHAILDQPIEPLELVVGVSDLALQSRTRALTVSAFSERRDEREDKIMARRSG